MRNPPTLSFALHHHGEGLPHVVVHDIAEQEKKESFSLPTHDESMRASNPWRNRAHVETPFPPTPVLAHFECALSRSAGGARRRKTANETRHKVVPEEREPLRPVRRQMSPFNTAVLAAIESLVINRVSRMVPGIAPAVFSIKGRHLTENPQNPSRSKTGFFVARRPGHLRPVL